MLQFTLVMALKKMPFFDVRNLRNLNLVITFGLIVLSNIFVAGLLGYYIDKWTFKNHLIFIIFLFLGVGSGLYNGVKYLIREVDKLDRIARERKEDDSGHTDSHND